jgi:hypothetical protein
MCTILVENLFVIRHVLKPVCKWEHITKMDLRKIGCKNWRKEQAHDLWNEFNLQVLLLECVVKLQRLLSWVICKDINESES